jgi:hypothetical protein
MPRFLAAQMARRHHFDLRRAREDIGYRARISMAEGMRRLAASWRREEVAGRGAQTFDVFANPLARRRRKH